MRAEKGSNAHQACKIEFAKAAVIQDQRERDRAASFASELAYRREIRRIERGNRQERLAARGLGARNTSA